MIFPPLITKSTKTIIFFGLFLFLSSVAACSSSNETISEQTYNQSTQTEMPTATPPLSPPEQGTIRVASTGAAPHNDVHRLTNEWMVLHGPALAYSRLLKFETSELDMKVECDLCRSWRWIDELTLEFEIDGRAKWQDGENFATRPVSAQDVVFSLERLRTKGFPHSSLLDSVDEIIVISDDTLQITLHFADSDFLQNLASPYAVIMAPDAIGSDVLISPPTGSGPWRWSQGDSGQVNLEAWDLHHRNGTPAVEMIEMIPVSDLSTGASLLKLGLVDIAQIEPSSDSIINGDSINLVEVPRQGLGSIFIFNQDREPFNETDVRRVFLRSLEPWDALTSSFIKGRVGIGIPLTTLTWELEHEVFRSYFKKNDEPLMLASDIEPVTLLVANFGEKHVVLGENIAKQLQDSGLTVDIEVVNRREYFQRGWNDRDFDLLIGPVPPSHTTNDFLYGLIHSQGEQNITGYKNSEMDRLIESQSKEMDADLRNHFLQKIQKMLMDDAVLFMPVITTELWGFGPRVKDFNPSMPMGSGDFWSTVTLIGNP